MRIWKTNTILKRHVNKLFTDEKVKGAKVKSRSILISEYKYWDGEESFNITNNNLLIRFNKTQVIFLSVTRISSILLTTPATIEHVERANSKEHVA